MQLEGEISSSKAELQSKERELTEAKRMHALLEAKISGRCFVGVVCVVYMICSWCLLLCCPFRHCCLVALEKREEALSTSLLQEQTSSKKQIKQWEEALVSMQGDVDALEQVCMWEWMNSIHSCTKVSKYTLDYCRECRYKHGQDKDINACHFHCIDIFSPRSDFCVVMRLGETRTGCTAEEGS